MGTVTGRMPSDNPLAVAIIDGSLVVVTLIAYVLTQGWRAWDHTRRSTGSGPGQHLGMNSV